MEIYNEQGEILNQSPSFRSHLIKTFIWMFVGVAVTFVIAFILGNWMMNNPYTFMKLMSDAPFLPIVMIVAQLGVVIALSAGLMKLPPIATKVLFLGYSALTGVTFSTLMIVYSGESIAQAFLCAAIYFGSLVVIGLTTKRDLTSIGTICVAGLFAMIIYSLLAMVFGWGFNNLIYCLIGLVIFAGITAWDAQKLKKNYIQYETQPEILEKLSIYSAFQLYLDFINIFLYILRIFGNGNK